MIFLGIVVPTLASALFELALWVLVQPRPQPAEVFGRILLMLAASTVFTGFMVTLLKRSERQRQEAQLSRRLAWRALEAQEEERRRLARELHDGVAQGLYSLRLASQNGQPIHEILTGLMEEVDQLAKNLWPPVLERLGLGMALQTQLGKLAQVEIEEIVPRLDPPREAALFRIAQEAVSNALRHGQASQVKIGLRRHQGEVQLTIEDNGRGFNPQMESQGLGLLSMRERAQAAQGRFQLHSAPGQGTKVEVSLP